MALAVVTLLVAVSLTSALPAVLDVRPALLLLSAATAVIVASGWNRLRGRFARLFAAAVMALSGLAALASARDLFGIYRAEEVRFASADPRIELAGTLFVPRGGEAHPAVVILHGSGPETRSEYAFYARRFARAGIVALAYDKRGTGRSSGEFAGAAYEQFAADAVGAIRMLRSRPEVEAHHVGVLGISEGEWVGALAAVSSDPAFLVLVSPSAMTPSAQVQYETGARVLRAGFTPESAARARELYGKLAGFQRTGEGRDELNRELAAASREPWFPAAAYLDEAVPAYDHVLALKWFPAWRREMDFDALQLDSRIRCPVLAQAGGDDPKNDGHAVLDRLRAAFERGGNTQFIGLLYPEAGHGLIVWRLPLHLPPPWFASGHLDDQLAWVVRVVGSS